MCRWESVSWSLYAEVQTPGVRTPGVCTLESVCWSPDPGSLYDGVCMLESGPRESGPQESGVCVLESGPRESGPRESVRWSLYDGVCTMESVCWSPDPGSPDLIT